MTAAEPSRCPKCGEEGTVDHRTGYVYCFNEECEVANIKSWIAAYGNNKESVGK